MLLTYFTNCADECEILIVLTNGLKFWNSDKEWNTIIQRQDQQL